MMQRVLMLAGLILLVCIRPLYAQPLVITSNITISEGMEYEYVVIRGQETIVNMTGGTIIALIVMDNAAFNMSGGTVMDIKLYDTATATISSASIITYGYTYGSSHLTITGFSGEAPSISAYHLSVINITGGNFTNALSGLYDSCIINISGGIFYAVMSYSNGNCTFYISGGTIDNLYLVDGNRAYISGGNIGTIMRTALATFSLSANEMEIFHIYGTNLTAVPYGNTLSDPGTASGNWLNGNPFVMNLPDVSIYNNLVLHEGEQPPSPCIASPATDLNGDCVVDMQDLAYMASQWLETGKQL